MRCLLLVSKTSYRTESFARAAQRIGVELVLGSDRCHQLAREWTDEEFARVLGNVDGTLALDFRHVDRAAAKIVEAAASQRFDAVVPTDDATAVIAAHACKALGLRGNAPEAAEIARD